MNSPESDKEWDAFLQQLSELKKKYQAILKELDEAHLKLQTLEKTPAQIPNPSPANDAAQEPTPISKSPKGGILARLNSRLESFRVRSPRVSGQSSTQGTYPQNFATCSRCRHTIVHPTRFCESCGCDFGGLVCSCGRGLSDSVKFCDHCGRRVAEGT